MKWLAIAFCGLVFLFCALACFSFAFAVQYKSEDMEKEEALARGFAGGAVMALLAAGLILWA